MLLLQPEWYKKLEEKDKAEVYDTKIDLTKENVTQDDMRRIANEVNQINKNATNSEIPEPAPLSEEWANPISLTEE